MRARDAAWPLLYAAVALVVAGPLLAPGFVFALDHAMGPQSGQHYARYLWENVDPIQSKGGYALLVLALDALLPMWLAQKLVLFVPFFLAGWGAHRLAQGRVSMPAAFFAGLLYALGPFAYIRGVAGQTGVLWAYALAPWFLRAWLRFVDTGDRRALARAVLLVALTLVFQAHGAALLAFLVAALWAVRLFRAPRDWRSSLRAPLTLAAWSLLLSLYWLIPVLLAPRTTLDALGAGDRSAFATTSAGLPSVGIAALTLQGFWREAAYAGPYPTAWLLVAPAIVLFLCVHALRTRPDDATLGVALAGGLGFVLAIVASVPALAPLADALWRHVPFMEGFRDAHKLLALLALAYAWLAPVGFDALVASARGLKLPRAAPLAIGALLLVPLVGASPLVGGYGSQLGVAPYPEEWAQAEALSAGCEGTMVVLPWHLYSDLSWIPNDDKRVTGPAKLYFSCPTIMSDALELGDAASQASTPRTRHVDEQLQRLEETRAFGASCVPRTCSTSSSSRRRMGKRASPRSIDRRTFASCSPMRASASTRTSRRKFLPTSRWPRRAAGSPRWLRV